MPGLWMVVGSLLFASMGACVKMASEHFNAAELLFYRGLIGMIMLFFLARRRGISLATSYPRMHLWRSIVGVGSLGGWFYALGKLPLATAMTFNYMSSIWIAVFMIAGSVAYWRPSISNHRPPMQWGLLLAIIAGFAGVIMMLRPSFEEDQSFATVVGLLSGMFAALAYMQVAALGRVGEPDVRVVFYFSLGTVVAGGSVMSMGDAHSLLQPAALWLLPVGILATLGQLCITYAYTKTSSASNTLVVSSLHYTGIIFASLYGMIVFRENISLVAWLGMALIIASGLAATVLRARENSVKV